MKHTKRVAFLGLTASLALILSYVELLLPPIWTAVPGVKMGLPNIVIIFLLYKCTLKEAATVSAVRLILVALLFGNAMTLAYSIAGAVLSLLVMAGLKRTKLFSHVGVSIAGAVMHNLGQVLVAMVLLQTKEIGYYMIVLAVTGTLAGIVIGLAGSLLLKYTEKVRL